MQGQNKWKKCKEKRMWQLIYNLPESEEEQAKDRYKEDEVACRKIFEVMEMENIEQKQLIRLGKREEYKIRPVLVKKKLHDFFYLSKRSPG